MQRVKTSFEKFLSTGRTFLALKFCRLLKFHNTAPPCLKICQSGKGNAFQIGQLRFDFHLQDFYLEDPTTHKRVLTLYNPYDQDITFKGKPFQASTSKYCLEIYKSPHEKVNTFMEAMPKTDLMSQWCPML
jgi:hypothetical protein